MRVLAIAMLLVPFAGCLDADPAAPTPDPAQPMGLSITTMPAPDASAGLDRRAFIDTFTATVATPPYNLALGGDILVASLGNPSGALAPPMSLLVLDATAPSIPIMGRLAFPGGGVESVAITPDDRYAFLGTEFSGAVGIWVIDLADPSDPRPVGYTPLLTEGPHNIRYAAFGGQEYILASISHVSTAGSVATGQQDTDPIHDLRVDILRFDRASASAPMATVSSYQARDTEGIDPGTPIVHDAVWQTHLITGQELMYVAHWDRGTRIVDITDPAAPAEIGGHWDPTPTDFLIIHTVKPHPTLIDGRHITVATSQCAYAPASECHLRILDTTDPTNPVQVATWTLPESTHGAGMTTEIFDLRDGVIAAPWGGAGIWLLDIDAVGSPEQPAVVGYHMLGDTHPVRFANAAVWLKDGLVLADARNGLHVFDVAAATMAQGVGAFA